MRIDDDGPLDELGTYLDQAWNQVADGDLAGAMESALQSLDIDAESPEVHNLIGYIHAAQGNAEKALEHYRTAIEADGDFLEAMLNAAELLIHPLDDLDAAVAMIDGALEHCRTREERADALLLKFDAFLSRGSHEQAAAVVKELPSGPFDAPHLDFLVGRAHFEVGNLGDAGPMLEAATAREPTNPEVFYYQGLLLEAHDDPRGATVAFLHSRELDMAQPRPPWATSTAMFERRVQKGIGRMSRELSDVLEGALVYVGDVPGAEIVAEGIDPRIPVLLEGAYVEDERFRVARAFVYQRNIERIASSPAETEQQVAEAFTREVEGALEHARSAPATS